MTSGLLARKAVVKAFEIDAAFSSALNDLFGNDKNFSLVEGDVLKTWQNEAASEAAAGTEPLFLLGNLPYNIAAALLADFIEKKKFFSRLVVTVQKEVAVRMTAGPGSKEYSSFSVLCASAYKARPLAVIKGASFYPSPRIDSQGVRLDLLPLEERKCASPFFQPLVRCLFVSRRKTIRNNLINFPVSGILKSVGGEAAGQRPAWDITEAALASSGLDGERRAETLSIEDFAALAEALEKTVCHG
jgi:16S rRNA (adenine1518-N6/adenine1519-N6)-dimethyltransferase